MKWVYYGDGKLEDIPRRVRLATDDGSVVITVDDGVGVVVSPGAGVQVMSLFRLEGEELFRYRIERLYPWDKIQRVDFEYLPPEEVDKDIWKRAQEVVAPERERAPAPAVH